MTRPILPHLAKEFRSLSRDPTGFAVAMAVPAMLVGAVAWLDLGRIEFPSHFRETDPSLLVLVLTTWFSGLTFGSAAMWKEKSQGTLERLETTPYSPMALILAKLAGTAVTVMTQSILVAILAAVVLADELTGIPKAQMVVPLSLGGVLGGAIGILASVAARSQAQASGLVMLCALGSLPLSGFFKPLADAATAGLVGSFLPFTLMYQALLGLGRTQTLGSAPLALAFVELILVVGLTRALLAWKASRRPLVS